MVVPWLGAIVSIWSVLLGAAFLSRMKGGLSRRSSMLIVTGCYLGLSALALLWLGATWNGFAGVFGMLLPYAVSSGIVLST